MVVDVTAAGRAQDSESSPVRERRSTMQPTNGGWCHSACCPLSDNCLNQKVADVYEVDEMTVIMFVLIIIGGD